MDLLRAPDDLRLACDDARRRGQRVGLVPTMGALHEGHMSLVREARQRAGFVIVTIFVNPTQFGPGEDLDRYPRMLKQDAERCEREGAAVVFAPETSAMYPPGDETRVHVGVTAEALCGAHRPGHFEGVATVVTKLFLLCGPCVAIFGRKDYQQWRVIARVVEDLFLPVEVVGAPIVREPDGLALSSRNAYLGVEERARARALSRGLFAAARAFETGEREVAALRQTALDIIGPAVDRIDYLEIADVHRVRPIADRVVDHALMAVAAHIGKTRLIDNVILGEDPWQSPPRRGLWTSPT
jgi:pantoate--beta-alanine ligase